MDYNIDDAAFFCCPVAPQCGRCAARDGARAKARERGARARRESELKQLIVEEFLAFVDDSRVERTRKHPLETIVVISLLAVIRRADSFVAIEDDATIKHDWLATRSHSYAVSRRRDLDAMALTCTAGTRHQHGVGRTVELAPF